MIGTNALSAAARKWVLHLVAQDAVELLAPVADHPRQALPLCLS